MIQSQLAPGTLSQLDIVISGQQIWSLRRMYKTERQWKGNRSSNISMLDNHFPISNSQHESGIESLVIEAAPGGGKDGGPTLLGGVGAPLVGSVAGAAEAFA